jgi:glutathione S-transferase
MVASLNDTNSLITSTLRGGRGLFVWPALRDDPPRPELPLELYAFESCPYCRKVREVLSELDLEFIARTSAKGADAKRAFVRAQGGKAQFPFLVDPNRGVRLLESEAIIDYLMEHYGPGRFAVERALAPWNTLTSAVASVARARSASVITGFGGRAQPEQMLVLYQFEASPYCRKVREVMDQLNLDYLVRNVAKGSARRAELRAEGGRVMVPFLIDPNTSTRMYESDDICAYLLREYGDL